MWSVAVQSSASISHNRSFVQLNAALVAVATAAAPSPLPEKAPEQLMHTP